MTLYFCDWDRNKRSQAIRIYDENDSLLDEIVLGSFENGVKLSWLFQGTIKVKIVPLKTAGGSNAVLNGIFIDPTDDVIPPKKAKSDKPRRKVVFIAGVGSHGYDSHEHNAGSLYLAELLESVADVDCTVCLDCIPGSALSCEDADCVVVYSDGEGIHPLIGKEEMLQAMKKRGCGFVFLHYATVPPQRSQNNRSISNPLVEFVKETTGAVYEIYWAVNPFYTADFKSFVDHPITRGVKPFSLYDEWYFHLRFLNDLSTEEILKGGKDSKVVPILSCVPPNDVKSGEDGPFFGNPTVRERNGKPEIVACAIQRDDNGRGFHFTGGDVHANFAQPDYRKILVNGILWTSGLDVPANGYETANPTKAQLEKNQDEAPK